MQRDRIFSVVLTLGLTVAGCGGGTSDPDAASATPDAATTAVDAAVERDALALPDAFDPPDAYAPPIYVGLVADQQSMWSGHGEIGLQGGHYLCQDFVPGADHVCDYEEVVMAAARGELADIAMGTTAWLQRTTTVSVDGVDSPAGPGGNCNEWRFNGNHLADGEYITFDAPGVPTYHFDGDTFYDGIDNTHILPGQLECGGQMRAILCCAAAP